jgi:hypothetical protein
MQPNHHAIFTILRYASDVFANSKIGDPSLPCEMSRDAYLKEAETHIKLAKVVVMASSTSYRDERSSEAGTCSLIK